MDKRSKDKWKHVVNSKMKKWRSDAKTLSINLKKKKKKKLGLEQIEHFQTKLSGQAVLLKPDKTIKLVINYGTS